MKDTRKLRAAALTLGVVVLPTAVPAQISPGPLSRAHAKLEGSTHCLDCHDPGQGVAAGKCFACHKPLEERITAGEGLHAVAEYRDCRICHVEHQGVDFELVWWGREGRDAFDHTKTGHALAGRHARLSCEQCHKTPSYLGTVTACASCHLDEHRGQFASRACTACHDEEAWRPAPAFDHARTRWPLTGHHAAVGCNACHATRRADPAVPGASYRVFRAVAGRDCASCHTDVHQARLGSRCASCHSSSSWRGTNTAGFDHARTGYRLIARHADVACGECHRPGRSLRVRHESCADCHRDVHGEQLARRTDAGRCESCHDVSGFRPALFGPEDHAKTNYPLRGSHLAVACDQCHKPPPDPIPVASGAVRGAAMSFLFASTRCGACHEDPHRRETAPDTAPGDCERCHRVESWREVAFDHARTGYPLLERHTAVTCEGCHRRSEEGPGTPLAFVGTRKACEACHRDPHAGQFAAARGASSCDRCHVTDALNASKFVHDRDSAYPLDGAHARLTCETCHKREVRGGVSVVRYKPLPTSCGGCHGSGPSPVIGGQR